MTVVIVIASADGLVLAGDSRTSTQIAPDAPVRVLSDFTHKVFQGGVTRRRHLRMGFPRRWKHRRAHGQL